MADDEFNLDDPGSEGGSEASLDDFFQPTGGKGEGGSGGDSGSTVDDFFAPPADTPKPKAARPVTSDLPIEKSRLADFPEEPEPVEPVEPMEMAAPDEELAADGEGVTGKAKSFLARSWIFLVLFLVLLLAGGAAFMAYTKFFAPKPEPVAAAPKPKPKPAKPKPKPAPAPVATEPGGTVPAAAEGKTVEQPGVKPAAPAGIDTEEDVTAETKPTAKPGKPGKPGVAAVDTEPASEVAPLAPPKPPKGKPGKPAVVAAVDTEPEPAPVAAPPKPPKGKPAKPTATPAPAPKPAVAVPPKAPAVATAKPGKPAVTAKPAPLPPPKPGVKPAPLPPPKPAAKPASRPAPAVATAPRPAAAPTGGPYYVQVGSYMLESSKDQPEQDLRSLGFSQYHYTPMHRRMRVYHVLVGKNLDPDQARQITTQLQGLGYVPEAGPNGSVKVYSYGSSSVANSTRAKLQKAGFKNVAIKSETKTVTLDQLRVGGFATRAQAGKAQTELRRGGFRGCLIVKE